MNMANPISSAVPSFSRLERINTVTATDITVFINNTRKTIAKRLPRLQHLPEFNKPKGKDKKIALVGGGPSLKNHLNELREFKTIIACGSVNDYLMDQGIIPTYTTICDPDPISANYLTKTDSETRYLVASCCDDKVFEALKDRQIIMWHCHSPEQEIAVRELDKDFGQYIAICGGCTVGLRSISIAILLGYYNIHFFGFDSCMEGEAHHSYGFSTKEEDELIGTVHKIKLGNVAGDAPAEGDKLYHCIGYQMAQAEHFREFYENFHSSFEPTFHGTGLLPDLMDLIRRREVYLAQKAA